MFLCYANLNYIASKFKQKKPYMEGSQEIMTFLAKEFGVVGTVIGAAIYFLNRWFSEKQKKTESELESTLGIIRTRIDKLEAQNDGLQREMREMQKEHAGEYKNLTEQVVKVLTENNEIMRKVEVALENRKI
jgi:hypothetical protein